ncbi:hypothetical protein ACE1TI_11640 [Alteribacillus sp. JSM 102045]|uniref:hypothetical protein n=1 Tax=Alteribacillus sp. JSM 102045 TaxID=1562101 RepID=UPI0035C24435
MKSNTFEKLLTGKSKVVIFKKARHYECSLEKLLGKTLTEVENPQNLFTEAVTKHHCVSNDKQLE